MAVSGDVDRSDRMRCFHVGCLGGIVVVVVVEELLGSEGLGWLTRFSYMPSSSRMVMKGVTSKWWGFVYLRVEESRSARGV